MSIRVTGDALAPFLQILKDFEIYSQEKDINGMINRFAPDNDILSFGRFANKYDKPELKDHISDYFQHHSPYPSDYKKVVVYQYGEAACLCALVKGIYQQPDIRITLFLENHEGRWLIRHRHHSLSPE